MPKKPCIKICIDGPDKTGKKTQSNRLATNLANEGLEVLLVEVPIDDGVFHPKIYEMLKDGTAVTHPEMFQTFQAANRMMWQRLFLSEKESCCDVIVFDRWDVSSWVYGGAAGLSEDFLKVCSNRIVELDFYYIFDGPSFPTPGREDDSYEKISEFQGRVREGYQRWQRLNCGVSKLIDANKDVKVIEEEILQDFKSRFLPTGQPVS